jgi:two-component system phosphate regulon sensor histidine kinase PhoR
MKKKAIILVIVLTSMSLTGIIFTQVYWVNTALRLKEDQFDNSVRLAIKSVVNQLLQNKNDTIFQHKLNVLRCRRSRLDVFDYIEPHMLDSLMNDEMKCMKINSKYYFAVYNKVNNRFAIGPYISHEQALLTSPYQFSVSSIYRPGDYTLSVYFPSKTAIIIKMVSYWLIFSVLFLVVLIYSFIYVIMKILEQKKLSELKNDFINNMTHEFKTPITTASLAAEMILREEVMSHPNRIKKYAGIILDENSRLQNQIEQVLQVATFEQEGPRFKMKKTNAHYLLESVIESFELRIKESHARISVDLRAAKPTVMADKFHLLNVFYNLLDNSLKYTPNDPFIEISTWNQGDQLVIRFKDNGIGISHEHQKNIFKSLFRVPTGNIHEVHGFGLGLYYVKTVIEEHNGHIVLKSEPGKGSAFDIYLMINE